MKVCVGLIFLVVVLGLFAQGECKGECKDEAKIEKAYEECLEKGAAKAKGKEKELEDKCKEKSKKACGGKIPAGLDEALKSVNGMFEKLMGGKGIDLNKIGEQLKKQLGSGDIMDKIKGFLKKDE